MAKKVLIIIISIIAVAVALAAAVFILFQLSRANPVLPKKEVKIAGAVFEAEIANTTTTRTRGLSYRESLGENKAMLFVFPSEGRQGFWMKDMNFPLDIIWIRAKRVVGVSENVKPESGKSLLTLPVYYSPEPADMVLEVNAGEAAKYGIKTGDPVGLPGF